jgi:Putative MetA-pathway of phenol degradation
MIPLRAMWRGISLLCGLCLANTCSAQDLSPRAYVITPIHWNAIILTYSFNDGSILFDPSLPITDSTGKLSVPSFSYYHGFSFFGRSANITASLPYAVGHFQGNVNGNQEKIYRSGLMDTVYRLSVNLRGGPAMPAKEFATWRQKLLVGASLKVVAPTGQYDPTKLVTPGANRWAFKPEIGLSRRWGHWVLDGYGGVWFFTTNSEFFSHNQASPGTNTLSQGPMGSLEMHLSYDVKARFWFSVDGNYWYGGNRSVNGIPSANSLQSNSRIGGTASIPVNKHQSLKFSYSRGAVIRVGGDFQTVSAAWQYSWLGRPN